MIALQAQVSENDLPDISIVDSVRIQKIKLKPTDTVRAMRLITISYKPLSAGGVDTVTSKGAYLDSLQLLQAIAQKIVNENQRAADATYLWYQALKNNKGLGQYYKLFQRVGQGTYYQYMWNQSGAQVTGKWGVNSSAIPSHTFTVTTDQKATRDNPVPTGQQKYAGTFRIIAPNRIQLLGYAAKVNDIFDLVSPGVYMSLDGTTFIQKIQ